MAYQIKATLVRERPFLLTKSRLAPLGDIHFTHSLAQIFRTPPRSKRERLRVLCACVYICLFVCLRGGLRQIKYVHTSRRRFSNAFSQSVVATFYQSAADSWDDERDSQPPSAIPFSFYFGWKKRCVPPRLNIHMYI
jgi:hypothetical protein